MADFPAVLVIIIRTAKESLNCSYFLCHVTDLLSIVTSILWQGIPSMWLTDYLLRLYSSYHNRL